MKQIKIQETEDKMFRVWEEKWNGRTWLPLTRGIYKTKEEAEKVKKEMETKQ
jgi:septal ring-binding cell division protein DamX